MLISLNWHDFKRCWERKTYYMILIDILRAFDILDTILLDKMKCISFSDDPIEWFYSYLTNRSGQCLYRERVHQRSILGHLFFMLYDLTRKQNNNFSYRNNRNNLTDVFKITLTEETISKTKSIKAFQKAPFRNTTKWRTSRYTWKIYLKIAAIHSRSSSTETMTVPET